MVSTHFGFAHIVPMSNERGKRLANMRKSLGLTQKEAADRLIKAGIIESYHTYRNFEYGRQSVPDQAFEFLARLVRETPAPYGMREAVSLPMVSIPVIGSASAGAGNDLHPDEDEVFVPAHLVFGDCAAMTVEGDSMMPWLLPSDIVVARIGTPIRSGKAFLVRRQDDSVSVKMIHHNGTEWELRSLNPRYKPEPMDGQAVGLITGIYRVDGSLETMMVDPNGLVPS